MTEIRQYRATSVFQISPLNQYALSMQTTFKEVRRDIIWCRNLLTQVSSLTPPARTQWTSAKKAVITDTLKYSYSTIPTPSLLLGCHLHLEFPPFSDGNEWKSNKYTKLAWIVKFGWWNYREVAVQYVCSMFLESLCKSVPSFPSVRVTKNNLRYKDRNF